MKGADLNTVLHAPTLHGILKSPSDAVGVAQDEHRLGRRTRQIFGSKGKDQCLTRSSDAANNSMPFSQAARNLLRAAMSGCPQSRRARIDVLLRTAAAHNVTGVPMKSRSMHSTRAGAPAASGMP